MNSPTEELHSAATLGNDPAVLRALGAGADLQANHNRAAWLAAENGHVSTVRLLVDRGAPVGAHASIPALLAT